MNRDSVSAFSHRGDGSKRNANGDDITIDVPEWAIFLLIG